MSLGELPAALLNVVVQAAGEEHGWRLEVASPALRATSMECCAIRLGRCRWSYGDRAEFRPSWRHVAVALRRGPCYLGFITHSSRLYYFSRYGNFSCARVINK